MRSLIWNLAWNAVILGFCLGQALAQAQSKQIAPIPPVIHSLPARQLRAASRAWFMRGRQSPDQHMPAWHLLHAFKQAKHIPYVNRQRFLSHRLYSSSPSVTTGTWTELGPRPLNTSGSTLNGQPEQDYGNVSGRITAIAVDLANDPTGNTVYVGAAYGGIWKSTNALSSSPAFTPISDQTASLAVGAIALGPDVNPGIPTIYVGTGEPNNSADSYYGVGILKSTDGGKTWALSTNADNGTEQFLGLAFSKILIDPNNNQVILAAAANACCTSGTFSSSLNQDIAGLYRSTDGGSTWSLVQISGGPYDHSWTDLAYDPSTATYYAAIQGFGFYSSTDQGANWTALSTPYANGVPATQLMTSGQPYFSRASLAVGAGAVWAVITDGQGQQSMPTPCASGQTSSCDTGLVYSTDGGSIWNPISAPPGNSPDSLFCEPTGGSTPHCQGFYDQFIGVTPSGTALVVGGLDVWSTNTINGLSTQWTALTNGYAPLVNNVHTDQHALAFVNDTTWYIGNDGGLWNTTDAGGTGTPSDWTNLNATLGNIQFYSIAPDQSNAGIYVGGAQDNGSSKTANGGAWDRISLGDGGITETDPANSQDYFLQQDGTLNGLLLSINAGGTINNFQTVVNSSAISEWGTGGMPFELTFPYTLTPTNAAIAVIGTCRVWAGLSDPSSPGAGWAAISGDLTQSSQPTDCSSTAQGDYITALASAPSSASTIYAVTDNQQAWVTTDASCSQSANPTCSMATWNQISGNGLPTGLLNPFSSVAVNPTNPQIVYIGVQGFNSGHVFLSTNQGASWTDITGNLPDAPVNSILIDPQDPNFIYVASDTGVFVATDGGAAGANEIWQQLGSGLPDTAILQIIFSAVGPKMVVAATHGRGAWSIPALPDPDFSITATPASQNIMAGSSASITLNTAAINGDSSTVNLTCTAPVSGCTVSPASVSPGATATVTIAASDMADGNNTITVSATDGINTHTASATVTVQDFAITGSPASASVSPGGSATYTITLTPAGGFNSAIALTCTGAPSEATCALSPASVTPSGSGSSTATLTLNTTAASALPPFGGGPSPWIWPAALLLLAGTGLLAGILTQKRKLAWVGSVLLLSALAISCGGGSSSSPTAPSNPGTPAGTYTITVTGTSGSLSHNSTVSLTVN